MVGTSNIEHTFKLPQNTRTGPTITEIATAISGFSKGKTISLELDDYIKNILTKLVYSIKYKVPGNVRVQLIAWPSSSESVHEFIQKIKTLMSYEPNQDDDVSKVFAEYENLFERSWKWCSGQWQKIIGSTYIQELFTTLE